VGRGHLAQIIEMVPAERTVMFSIDYPRWGNDPPFRERPGIPAEPKEPILWKDAA
jgi:hypothetical protein